MPLLGRSFLGQVRLVHSKSQPIVVVAAARTPCGKYHGQLAPLNAWQLGQIAVEAVVKRSAIPLEKIHHIFMNETHALKEEHESKLIFTPLLKKSKYTSVRIEENPEMDSFQMALEFVKSKPESTAVAGGYVSATNNQNIENSSGDLKKEISESFARKSLARYKKSQSEAIFDSELVPVKVQKQQGQSRYIEEIFQDEIFTENFEALNRTCQLCDEASAVVLTSLDNALEMKVSPLAVVRGFEYLNNTDNTLDDSLQCLEKLFTKIGIQSHQIKHWEIDNALPQLIHHLEHNFKLNSHLINPHGCSQVLGYSPITSFTRLLTHISHALNANEYGCVIAGSQRNIFALIVQKLSSMPHHLPLVTLYTKNPCPLCDMLVEELQLNFAGEFELEKVFIDTKENVRFLRLYRYDIPVVFLNNQFLCMHCLNHRLLRKRLNLLSRTNL